jgi:hypothetical protein
VGNILVRTKKWRSGIKKTQFFVHRIADNIGGEQHNRINHQQVFDDRRYIGKGISALIIIHILIGVRLID